MEYKLRNMSWAQVAERMKTVKTVILPAGACETYGPHNPLGADILVAKKLSEMLAERVNGIVGPCVEAGQSKYFGGFPGTIAISAEALKAVYRDIVASFVQMGFKRFFMVNNHLHNTQPLNEVLEDARLQYGIKYLQVGVWQYLPAVSDHTGMWETPAPHAHASEAQTSVLLYLYPELVDMSKAPNSPSLVEDRWPAIMKSTPWNEITDSGTLGNAQVATAEKGRKAVELMLADMEDCVKNFLEKD